MASAAELKDLIGTLNRAEKAKLRAWFRENGKGADPKYQQLFEGLDKGISEKELKKSLGLQAKASAWTNLRSYLFDTILEVLLSQRGPAEINLTVRKLISRAEILRRRNLHQQALKLLGRARRLSIEFERFTYLSEAIRQIRVIRYERGMNISAQEEVSEGREVLEQAMHAELEINDLIGLLTRYSWMIKQGIFSPTDLRREFEGHPLLRDPGAILSFTGRSYAWMLLGSLYSVLGEREKAFAIRVRLQEDFRAHPHLIALKTGQFTGNLFNLTNTAMELRRYQQARTFLDELKAWAEKGSNTDRLGRFLQIRVTSLELLFFVNTEQFEAGGNLLESLDLPVRVEESDLMQEQEVTIWLYAALIWLGQEKLRMAMRAVGAILNTRMKKMRQDLLLFARILHIWGNLKMGELDYAYEKGKELQRSLRREGQELDWEKAVAALLVKLAEGKEKEAKRFLEESAGREDRRYAEWRVEWFRKALAKSYA